MMDEDGKTLEARLSELIAKVAQRRFGSAEWKEPLRLSLEFGSGEDGAWRLRDAGLVDTIEAGLAEVAAQSSPLQVARVYCHRCESAECSHSLPALATEVFAGYSQTGQAAWADLGQVLLEHRHPDIDRFYQGSSRLLARVIPGRDLKEIQLVAFGRRSKRYDILQQVVSGHHELRAPNARGQDTHQRVALTLQAVESRGQRGEIKLALNVIGRTEGGEDALPLLVDAQGERVAAPVRKARESLRALEDKLRDPRIGGEKDERSKVLRNVPGIMKRLARDLTVDVRRSRGRTAHAEERRRQSRPVQSAVRESLSSTPEKTFVDEREDTIVVLGRRNRVHVFSQDGRLVTSLALEPGAVDRRLRQKRWRRVRPEEFDTFHGALQAGHET